MFSLLPSSLVFPSPMFSSRLFRWITFENFPSWTASVRVCLSSGCGWMAHEEIGILSFKLIRKRNVISNGYSIVYCIHMRVAPVSFCSVSAEFQFGVCMWEFCILLRDIKSIAIYAMCRLNLFQKFVCQRRLWMWHNVVFCQFYMG